MTQSLIRSGGSLNYLSSLAQDWFRRVEHRTDWSLHDQIEAAGDALQIAERFCAIVSCPLDVLIVRATGKPSPMEPFLAVPEALTKSVHLSCKEIKVDNTRYTTKARAKWGVDLVRFVATLARFGDLNLLEAAARRSDAIETPERVKIERVGDTTIEAGDDPILAIEARLAIGELRDCSALFRRAITVRGAEVAIPGSDLSIPENFGMDLQGLQRFTHKAIGRYNVRSDLKQSFEPATPRLVQVDHEELSAYKLLIASVNDADDSQRSVGCDPLLASVPSELNIRHHFQHAQWDVSVDPAQRIDERKYKNLVSTVRRKRITVKNSSYQPSFTYGTVREVEVCFAAGKSIIATGLSGTGKSTLLAKLPTSGATVFQLGGENHVSRPRHFTYLISQADQMIKKARRTSGRKILIAHEFFISPRLLERLGNFDQFAFVGDPRQPGASGDSSHLFRFIKDIGGKSFKLSVVWRASNPLSMMTVNYFAYGSQFKICTRPIKDTVDMQFELIVCDDSVLVIAARMLAYAAQKAKLGRSVMIGASGVELVEAMKSLMSLDPQCPENIQCRYLSDLQGREADVLIVDLHDVAVAIPAPDDALRYFIMLLGRARHTTCFALGRRNMSTDPEAALPIEVYAGVALRYRVRSNETMILKRSGYHFERLSQMYNLVLIDEETIALMSTLNTWTQIMLIKSRESHNAAMVKDLYLTIEAPDFFSKDDDVEHQSSILTYFSPSSTIPLAGKVYSFDEIQHYIMRQRS